MPSPISHLLNTTITYRQITGTDGNGDHVLGNPICIPVYKDNKRRMVRSSTGEEVVSNVSVVSDCFIPDRCVLWLANQNVLDDTLCREPLAVESSGDPLDSEFVIYEAAL